MRPRSSLFHIVSSFTFVIWRLTTLENCDFPCLKKNWERQTDRPTDHPTDRWTNGHDLFNRSVVAIEMINLGTVGRKLTFYHLWRTNKAFKTGCYSKLVPTKETVNFNIYHPTICLEIHRNLNLVFKMGCNKSKPEAPKKSENDIKKSESKKFSAENENENANPNYVSFII